MGPADVWKGIAGRGNAGKAAGRGNIWKPCGWSGVSKREGGKR